jgi:hypothetical protein
LKRYLGLAEEVRYYTEHSYLKFFTIKFLDPGSILPHPKTQKIRRVMDER